MAVFALPVHAEHIIKPSHNITRINVSKRDAFRFVFACSTYAPTN
jgi:hypothetical protein